MQKIKQEKKIEIARDFYNHYIQYKKVGIKFRLIDFIIDIINKTEEEFFLNNKTNKNANDNQQSKRNY
jgi:hypothetical protein